MRATKMLPIFRVVQYLLFISIVYKPVLAADESLRFISVVFRHGDRTPAKQESYPKDPNSPQNANINYFDPPGYGQLTKSGELREFNLGVFLRNTYDDFLGANYTPGILESVSTDVNRTKESLKLVLKGMYPNSENIPTTFNDKIKDSLLFPQACPAYAIDYLQARRKPDIKIRMAKLQDFIKQLSQWTGLNVNSALDMYLLYTTLETEKFMNLTLPPWTENVYPNGELLTGTLIELDIMNYDDNMKKRNGGRLVKKFLEDMESVQSGQMDEKRKLMLYSAHDLNVLAVLKALNVYYPHVPKFSSSVIVELHSINDVYYVKVKYYLGVPAEAVTLIIPGCSELCPLTEFSKLVTNVVPTGFNFCDKIRDFTSNTLSGILNIFKGIFS